MTKKNKFGGWHRLWASISIIYIIIIFLMEFNGWPNAEIEKRSWMRIDATLADNIATDWNNQQVDNDQLITKFFKSSEGNWIQIDIPSSRAGDRNKKKERLETARIINEAFQNEKPVDVSELRLKRTAFIRDAAFTALLPIIGIYILGFLLHWIGAGFRSNEAEAKK